MVTHVTQQIFRNIIYTLEASLYGASSPPFLANCITNNNSLSFHEAHLHPFLHYLLWNHQPLRRRQHPEIRAHPYLPEKERKKKDLRQLHQLCARASINESRCRAPCLPLSSSFRLQLKQLGSEGSLSCRRCVLRLSSWSRLLQGTNNL